MSRDTADESVPRRVGRYEIVGPLASGGMAEILLGRLVGPSGFQRAVVIKRILRHLAKRQDFVDMFLDEARIVASIRHPNVVQVHELGHDNDDLFLVMEYLEGESTAGLMRRLHANGENLDFALCAYIVAEACSGLHAAHELTDSSGKHLGVVHRDVTPHNVFIGYGGRIKLLDFGIATASEESGRIAQTEAGQFKGKLEYASPEQCRGKPLDRRSDLFALGTILWELTTGMRLFKRPSALDMAKAICERPIPPPSSIVKDYPEELVPIVMKALARNRKDRYQTALELRKDLLNVIRKLSPSVSLDEDLATVMHRLFAKRIEEKGDMLRNMERGKTVDVVPVGEADAEVQIPVAQGDEPADLTETDSQTDPQPDPRSDPPSDPASDRLPDPQPAPRAVAADTVGDTVALPRPPSSPELPGRPAPPIARVETRGHTRKITPDVLAQAQAMAAKGLTTPIGAGAGPDTSTGTATGTTGGVATPGHDFRPSPLPRTLVARIGIGAAALIAIVGVILIAVSLGARSVDRGDTAGSATAIPIASEEAPLLAPTSLPTSPTASPTMLPTAAAGTESESPTGAGTAVASVEGVAATNKIDTTLVHIDTVPTKASIYVNGTKKGVSPLDLRVAKGTTPLNVEIRQTGFVTVKEKIVPDANHKLRITLVPGPAASAGAPYHRFD